MRKNYRGKLAIAEYGDALGVVHSRSIKATSIVASLVFLCALSPMASSAVSGLGSSIRTASTVGNTVAFAMNESLSIEEFNVVEMPLVGVSQEFIGSQRNVPELTGELALALSLPFDACLSNVSTEDRLIGYETDLASSEALLSLGNAMKEKGWVIATSNNEGVACASFMRKSDSLRWAFASAYSIGDMTSIVLKVA